MTDINNPARLLADLRASEAADAIGLAYRHSRVTLYRILREGQPESEPSPFLKQCFEWGKFAEPFTHATYCDVFKTQDARKGFTLFRKLEKFLIAASPDAIGLGGTVEYKSKMRGSDLPYAPKPEHLIQTIIQMWAAHSHVGKLFYHNLWNGNYVCFPIHWNQKVWDNEVSKWLLEFLECRSAPPPRMKNGEADKRARILLDAFWKNERTSQDFSSTGQD
jgi:hypothetical protein